MMKIVSFRDAIADAALACEWQSAMGTTQNLYAMYQSIPWLSTVDGQGSVSVVVKGEPSGACILPLATNPVRLKFSLSRGVQPGITLRCVELLGGEPVGGLTYDSCEEILEAIWKERPEIDGVYMKSVMESSALWSILEEHGWTVGRARAYKPEGERPFHYLVLPESFEAYLSQFRKKQRYNLKRQVRVLAEASSNALELCCIRDVVDVDRLIDCVGVVTERSWKSGTLAHAIPEIVKKPEYLADLPRKRLLHSYVLNVNGAPCAYVLGYLYNGIYHYANIGYDLRLASYSPGNVLLFLVVEDLIGKASASVLNFGISDAEYKRIFGNRHVRDASILLMRPSTRNRFCRAVHRGFRTAKDGIKRLVSARAKQKPPVGVDGETDCPDSPRHYEPHVRASL